MSRISLFHVSAFLISFAVLGHSAVARALDIEDTVQCTDNQDEITYKTWHYTNGARPGRDTVLFTESLKFKDQVLLDFQRSQSGARKNLREARLNWIVETKKIISDSPPGSEYRTLEYTQDLALSEITNEVIYSQLGKRELTVEMKCTRRSHKTPRK